MADIAAALEKAWVSPESVQHFAEWLHEETPPNEEQYAAEHEVVSAAWSRRFNDGKHEAMCRLPRCVTESSELSGGGADGDAAAFVARYDREAQFMFSRVQEHVHLKTKKGFRPLRSCLSHRCKTKCKHGFPKIVRLRGVVVCNGNYRRLNVRISGRRNSLGVYLGRRSAEYVSGTMRAFAVATGSNTHTAPNYRLPPCKESHDEECKNVECQASISTEEPPHKRPLLLRLCKSHTESE
jgi:hypothetical protein